jgi:hypothetical protein
MRTIQLASIAGENGPESHLVVEKGEDGSRKVLKAFPSLDKGRSFAEAMVELSADCEQGWPEPKPRGAAA